MQFHELFDNAELKKQDSNDELLPQMSSDDWINQLQMFDLPQFFTNYNSDTPDSVYSPPQDQVVADFTDGNVNANNGANVIGEPTPAEINAVIQQHVIKENQYPVPGPVKRSRAKSNSPINQPATKSAVSLTREQLLSFSSEDMDNFEKSITATRALTPAERKEMKRQRRLIKNRESAHLSRRRKKDRVDELEHIVGGLTTVNNTLNAKLQNLEAESTTLKAEVSQLIGVIRDSPILSGLLRNVTSVLVFYAMQASEAQKLASTPTPLQQTHNSIEAC